MKLGLTMHHCMTDFKSNSRLCQHLYVIFFKSLNFDTFLLYYQIYKHNRVICEYCLSFFFKLTNLLKLTMLISSKNKKRHEEKKQFGYYPSFVPVHLELATRVPIHTLFRVTSRRGKNVGSNHTVVEIFF